MKMQLRLFVLDLEISAGAALEQSVKFPGSCIRIPLMLIICNNSAATSQFSPLLGFHNEES